MTIPVQEVLTVSFENALHQRYAHLLVGYGFEMTVLPSLRIGRSFRHPKLLHRVDLETDDEGGDVLFPKLLIFRAREGVSSRLYPVSADFDIPMHPSHYSDAEWEILVGDRPDDFALLERELFVWFRVRPRTLNSLKSLS